MRKSGEPYIYHPLEVARIVAKDIGLDYISVAAAILHDTVEDTEVTLEDLDETVGSDISRIVDGLTKISTLKKNEDYSVQAENYRKMLLTLHSDIRVILIKTADRLHNMRTIDFLSKAKQDQMASESLYIYAPLAHRIGLYNMKNELENLSIACSRCNHQKGRKLDVLPASDARLQDVITRLKLRKEERYRPPIEKLAYLFEGRLLS